MIRRFAIILLFLSVSGGILLISLFRNASIKYAFTAPASTSKNPSDIEINYDLAYPGRILPDSPLWPLKVVRDKVWLLMSLSHVKKSQVNLLLADKRIGSALTLFQKGKANLAYSTLTKSEKYLEASEAEANLAQVGGENTDDIMQRIALATLKHAQLDLQILSLAPDDAKPQIIITMKNTKNVFLTNQSSLLSRGLELPKDPFSWN